MERGKCCAELAKNGIYRHRWIFFRAAEGKTILPFPTQIGSMDCSIMSLLLQRGGVAE